MDIQEKDIPGIFIASLPKSGTVFLSDSLCHGLNKKALGFPTGGLFPWATIPHEAINTLMKNGSVYVIHCAPSNYNKTEINQRLEKMVVHVRDPRQSLISFSFFLPALIEKLDPIYAIHMGVPNDYLSLNYTEQLDWLCRYYFSHQTKWIDGWLDAHFDNRFKTEILFTNHEDLLADQKAFFEGILSFYSIPLNDFTFPEKPKVGTQNFRKGETKEWKRVLSPDQISMVSQMIPEKLYDFFKWERVETKRISIVPVKKSNDQEMSSIHLHHVGGRGGNRRFPVLEHFEKDIVNVLYEVDSHCIDDIHNELSELTSKQVVVPIGLGASSAKSDFYRLWIGSASSCLPVSNTFKQKYPYFTEHTIICDPDSMEPVETESVTLTSLDQILEEGYYVHQAPDFLSLNTQGSELSILRGGNKAISRSTIAVSTEVSLTEIYLNQAGLDDMTQFLSECGFRLFNIFPHGRRTHGFRLSDKIIKTPIGLSGGGSIMQMDALYFKEPSWIMEHHQNPFNDLIKGVFIGFVFGFFDYCYACSVLLTERYQDDVKELTDENNYIDFVKEYLSARSEYNNIFPVSWTSLFKPEEITKFDSEHVKLHYFANVSRDEFLKASSHLNDQDYIGLELLALRFGFSEQADILKHSRISMFWDTMRYLGLVNESGNGEMFLDMNQINTL